MVGTIKPIFFLRCAFIETLKIYFTRVLLLRVFVALISFPFNFCVDPIIKCGPLQQSPPPSHLDRNTFILNVLDLYNMYSFQGSRIIRSVTWVYIWVFMKTEISPLPTKLLSEINGCSILQYSNYTYYIWWNWLPVWYSQWWKIRYSWLEFETRL